MAVAATGFFDGVHSGHRAVLREIIRQADDRGTESAVVTFWPHPRFILRSDGDRLRLLNTIEEKEALIRACGIGQVHVIPFTEEFSRLSAEAFMKEYLIAGYSVDTLVVGYDHRIGRENISGVKLVLLAEKCGMEVCMVPEEAVAGSHVSSTVIRKCIAGGDVVEASRLLGYDYSIRCSVSSASGGMTVLTPADGYKVLPCPGRYRISVDGNGCTCETFTDTVLIYGDAVSDEQYVRITFLEKSE